jgi:hypothetical protein
VIAVQDAVITSLRGNFDLNLIQRRLSLSDCLASHTFDAELAYVRLPGRGPPAALATFVARCQGDDQDWAWCVRVLRGASLDAAELVNQAAQTVPTGDRGRYGAPVAHFIDRSNRNEERGIVAG